MQAQPILTVAAKEFRDRIRNRWVLAVALVFAVFSLVITYFGSAQQGVVGFRSIEITIASLVSLVIYLIPLIALLLGFDAIVGEREILYYRNPMGLPDTSPEPKKDSMGMDYVPVYADDRADDAGVVVVSPARAARSLR